MTSHLAWPLRLAALAGGVFVALALAAPLSAARWAAAGWGAASTVALVGMLALLATDGPVARRVGPRSRRAAWSSRMALAAAVALALAHPVALLVAGALLGAGVGVLAREARASVSRDLALAALSGALLAAGVLVLSSARAALGLALAAHLAWALAALGATFHGGPGRPPARPSDVVWLYLLGTALAVALGFR